MTNTARSATQTTRATHSQPPLRRELGVVPLAGSRVGWPELFTVIASTVALPPTIPQPVHQLEHYHLCHTIQPERPENVTTSIDCAVPWFAALCSRCVDLLARRDVGVV